MVQDVGAVITQITNRIVPVMRIIECANAEAWEAIQVQHLFEIADLVGCEVEHTERYQAIEADADLFDMVASKVNMLKPLERTKSNNSIDMIAINPQFLEHDAFFESRRLRNPIIAKIQLTNVPQLIEAFDLIEIVVGQPAFF